MSSHGTPGSGPERAAALRRALDGEESGVGGEADAGETPCSAGSDEGTVAGKLILSCVVPYPRALDPASTRVGHDRDRPPRLEHRAVQPEGALARGQEAERPA